MTVSASGAPFDLVLTGGRVIDERNRVDGGFDVALKEGRIAAVGRELATGAARTRDVTGCIVVPGLIDIHTHV
jgi:dihydroorotase